MAKPQVTLPPDAESTSANRRRERFLLRVGGFVMLVALVSICLSYLLRSWEMPSLLMGIFGVSCLGLAGFAVLAIVWRRACGWRGHSFRETDVFPGGALRYMSVVTADSIVLSPVKPRQRLTKRCSEPLAALMRSFQ
jgi:hypothetical protein